MNNCKVPLNKDILDFTFPQNHMNRNFKQKMVRSMESNEDHNIERMKHNNYQQNQKVTNIPDFQSIEHNPQYSSSSRGYMIPEKSNYSLSPNHTKAPSDNSNYFMLNSSSRNARRQGKLEHIKTDPSAMYAEDQDSRNKYPGSSGIFGPSNTKIKHSGNHHNENLPNAKIYQRSYDHETGHFMNQK